MSKITEELENLNEHDKLLLKVVLGGVDPSTDSLLFKKYIAHKLERILDSEEVWFVLPDGFEDEQGIPQIECNCGIPAVGEFIKLRLLHKKYNEKSEFWFKVTRILRNIYVREGNLRSALYGQKMNVEVYLEEVSIEEVFPD